MWTLIATAFIRLPISRTSVSHCLAPSVSVPFSSLHYLRMALESSLMPSSLKCYGSRSHGLYTSSDSKASLFLCVLFLRFLPSFSSLSGLYVSLMAFLAGNAHCHYLCVSSYSIDFFVSPFAFIWILFCFLFASKLKVLANDHSQVSVIASLPFIIFCNFIFVEGYHALRTSLFWCFSFSLHFIVREGSLGAASLSRKAFVFPLLGKQMVLSEPCSRNNHICGNWTAFIEQLISRFVVFPIAKFLPRISVMLLELISAYWYVVKALRRGGAAGAGWGGGWDGGWGWVRQRVRMLLWGGRDVLWLGWKIWICLSACVCVCGGLYVYLCLCAYVCMGMYVC